MGWGLLVLTAIMAVALGALWIAASHPDFWIGVVRSLVSAMLPSIAKAFKPKPLTDDQKETINQGGDPFKKRRPGTGGKNG
jgi:hypothetical protein